MDSVIINPIIFIQYETLSIESCKKGSQEFAVWEFTVTLPSGESEIFKSSHRSSDNEYDWAEVWCLEKVWDWVNERIPDEV